MSLSRSRIAVLAITLAIVVFGAIIQRNNKVQNQETPAVTQTPVTIPSDWQSYTNDTYDYQISFPPDYEVNQNGENSIMILNTSQNNPVGPASFVYISTVSSESINSEGGLVYNYSRERFDILKKLRVGERKSVAQPGVGLDEWFTYERVGDIQLAGKTARVFTNPRPWEFPGGTVEYLTFFEEGNTLYILGGYLHEQEVTKEIFDQIISSFTL